MPRNVMLHINNVFWMGGVPMFIRDFMLTYPQFHHVVTYIWDHCSFAPEPDYDMIQEWELVFGADVGHADGNLLTKEIVQGVDPAIMVMHCTSGKWVQKPHSWLNRWPKIFVHHMPTRPVFPADLDIFVSEFMAAKFEAQKKHMKRWVVCPPVIHADAFKDIQRKPENERCAVGKLCSAWNPKKYPNQMLRVMRALGEKHESVSFEVIGGAKYWSDPKVPRLTMPEEKSKGVPDFLRGYDIFLYINDPALPETWCRAVTEAMASGLPVVAEKRGGIVEQIEHGVDGFLCETDDEFAEVLEHLVASPQLRYDVGMKAREKAVSNFGLDRLKRETQDVVLGAAIGVV